MALQMASMALRRAVMGVELWKAIMDLWSRR